MEPLQLNDGRGFGFLAVLGSIFLVMILRRSELFWDELLLLVLGIGVAANHRRMVFVFGILAAPILSRLLSTVVGWLRCRGGSGAAQCGLDRGLTADRFLGFPEPSKL